MRIATPAGPWRHPTRHTAHVRKAVVAQVANAVDVPFPLKQLQVYVCAVSGGATAEQA